MKSTQLIGLLLWRAGLLLVGGWILFQGARRFLRYVDVPLELEIGFGLVLTGAALVLASMILERAQDVKSEGELTE